MEGVIRFMEFDRARSFIARSVSTYRCVVTRLSRPNQRVRWVRVSTVEAERCVSLLMLVSCKVESRLWKIQAIMSSIRWLQHALGRVLPHSVQGFRNEALHNHELCITAKSGRKARGGRTPGFSRNPRCTMLFSWVPGASFESKTESCPPLRRTVQRFCLSRRTQILFSIVSVESA